MTKRKPSWSDRCRRAAALCGSLLFLLATGPSLAASHTRSGAGKAPTAQGAVKRDARAGAVPAAKRAKAGKTPARAADFAVGPADIMDAEMTGLRGSASYYSNKFQGRRTSTGERFDARQFTAASNHFPLGSKVAVWRLDNGRCAVVKVNDRMAAGKSRRVIDLSRSAAEYFDMIRAGVIMVRVAPLRRGQTACHDAFAGERCADCAPGDEDSAQP